MSDEELLAVIIRSGTVGNDCISIAQQLLAYSGSLGLLGLMHLSTRDYESIPGIGKVKAIQLQCVAEISKRMVRASRKYAPVFNNPTEIAEYYMEEMRHLDQEQLRLVCLDTKSRLIRDSVISVGTVNHTCLSCREVYREALSCGAVYVILIHNHPSGDPNPSKEDISATRVLSEAGHIVGIPLIDHIIIGDHLYYSMRDEEMI